MQNLRLLQGRFYKNASGRESYEIMDANSMMILKISTLLLQQHGFRHSMPVIGLDEIYMDHSRGELRLTIGWDNWSGCFLQANNPDSDGFVREFGVVLDGVLYEFVTPLQGQLRDDNPARVCYEIYYANDGLTAKILPLIVDEFQCEHREDGHLCKAQQVMRFGWHRWRGCFIEATDAESAVLVRDIAAFLNMVILDDL